MTKKHALLVSDNEIDFILSQLLDVLEVHELKTLGNHKRAKQSFENEWFFNFDNFYERCQEVFNNFRKEAFR